jgi:hypothetical protein
MKMFQKLKLTDVEFVEQTRKQLQKSKRWIWFSLLFIGISSVLYCWYSISSVNHLASWMTELPRNPHDPSSGRAEQFYQSGMKLGAALGFGFGTTISGAIFIFSHLLNRLSVDRRDKLLVACYDQLHSLNK